MAEWTPSTEQVRSHYVFDQSDRWVAARGEAFDRWLKAVKRESKAEGLTDFIDNVILEGVLDDIPIDRWNLAAEGRERADGYRKTGEQSNG